MKLSRSAMQDLRRKFAGYTGSDKGLKNAGIDPIKDFLLIGALIDNGRLSLNDSSFLMVSFLVCNDLGVFIDPNFEVNVVNIDPQQGGEDFLSGDYKADCLVSCFVYNGPKVDECRKAHMKSDYSDIRNVWYNAAMLSDARFVVIFGHTQTEVTDRHFCGEDMMPLAVNDNRSAQLVIRRDVLGTLKL